MRRATMILKKGRVEVLDGVVSVMKIGGKTAAEWSLKVSMEVW